MTTWSNEGNKGGTKFEPHPPGVYAAVCCDVFEKVFPNPFHGQADKFTGKIDNRKDVTKVCIAYLTSETIEVDGEVKPRFSSFWAAQSWHEKSKLRTFVSKWLPEVGKLESVDPEQLVGKTAMVSVDNYTKRDGEIGHGVTVAMALPKGMAADVPSAAGYTRHKDKPEKTAPVTNDPPAAYAKGPGGAGAFEDTEAPF